MFLSFIFNRDGYMHRIASRIYRRTYKQLFKYFGINHLCKSYSAILSNFLALPAWCGKKFSLDTTFLPVCFSMSLRALPATAPPDFASLLNLLRSCESFCLVISVVFA